MVLCLSTKETDYGEGCVSAIAVPHTAEVIDDTRTTANCVRAKVGFCIRAMIRCLM